MEEVRRVAGEQPGHLRVVAEQGLAEDGSYRVTLGLRTGQLPYVEGGLRLLDEEQVVVSIPSTFPQVPPVVSVPHLRFVGHSHVLQGDRLCVYLDPHREWHPEQGILRFLNRLWRWFSDAATDKFDAAEALYHAVGGVLHESPGMPVVVVRQAFVAASQPFGHAYITHRTTSRLDLSWCKPNGGQYVTARVVRLRDPLYFGAGTSLRNLLFLIEHPRPETYGSTSFHQGWPTAEAVLTALAATARRNLDDTALYFVLAVPHTAAGGHHLLMGRLPTAVANAFRAGGEGVRGSGSLRRDARIEWCAMSDERPEITTRRDAQRPVSAFSDKHVHVWGCGGIGSWVAEFVARAGASRITLRDPGRVVGGLLVRQNFVEEHVGRNKAEALAERLQAISDDLLVTVEASSTPISVVQSWQDADVLIDATVNTALAYLLGGFLANETRKPLVAQMATDVRTGTLGILSVASRGHAAGPAAIDAEAGVRVLADAELERFHVFWQEPVAGDEFVPARGCSVPTFHGSSADLAAVAGALVTLLALHLDTDRSGTHLVALPHAEGEGPSRRFVPA